MEFIVATLKGIEDISAREISELAGAKAKKIAHGRLLFKADNADKLAEKGQSITRICNHIASFKFKEEKDIYKIIKKAEFKIKAPFVARCKRAGDHKFSSNDIEKKVGEIIFKKGYKVSLEKPSTRVIVDIVGNTCIVGTEIKDEMNKRKYRIKSHNQSVNACLAYSIIRIADFKEGETLIDPFCKDGVILIEASAYAKGKCRLLGMDNSHESIRSAKANAGYAGLKINFIKEHVEWLTTLFKKNEVDKIVTNPPAVSQRFKLQEAARIYKELFSQAAIILKKTGKIVIVSLKPDPIRQLKGKFKLLEERKAYVGEAKYTIMVFGK